MTALIKLGSTAYSGARETWKTLMGHKTAVDRIFEPSKKELFLQLISTIDGYAGLLKSTLLEEKKYWISETGTVDFSKASDGRPASGAVAAAYDRRLQQIQRLVFLLDSPSGLSVMPEAIDFSRMTVSAQREEIVRTKQTALSNGDLQLDFSVLERCRESIWELDRIVYYLSIEKSKAPAADTLTECIQGELERLKAAETKASAMPLHYAIRGLAHSGLVDNDSILGGLLTEVEQYLKDSDRDNHYQIRRNIEKIRQIAHASVGKITERAVMESAG